MHLYKYITLKLLVTQVYLYKFKKCGHNNTHEWMRLTLVWEGGSVFDNQSW